MCTGKGSQTRIRNVVKPRYQLKCAQRVSTKTFTTSGAGIAYPSEAPEFSPGFSIISCYSVFGFMRNVLQIVVCPFVLFRFSIVCPTSIYAF
jgi:hypothetical protein